MKPDMQHAREAPPSKPADEPGPVVRELGKASEEYRARTDGYTRKVIMWTVVALFVGWCLAALRLMSCHG